MSVARRDPCRFSLVNRSKWTADLEVAVTEVELEMLVANLEMLVAVGLKVMAAVELEMIVAVGLEVMADLEMVVTVGLEAVGLEVVVEVELKTVVAVGLEAMVVDLEMVAAVAVASHASSSFVVRAIASSRLVTSTSGGRGNWVVGTCRSPSGTTHTRSSRPDRSSAPSPCTRHTYEIGSNY